MLDMYTKIVAEIKVHFARTCICICIQDGVVDHATEILYTRNNLRAVLSKNKSSLALLSGLFCSLQEVEMIDVAPCVLDVSLTHRMT